MANLLTGKVIIVTGAGGGIGQAAAEYFAAEGAKVVAAGRTEESVVRRLALASLPLR